MKNSCKIRNLQSFENSEYLSHILFKDFLPHTCTHFGQEVIVFLVADLVFRLSAEGAIIVMANVGLMWRGSNSLKLKSGIINAST